MGALYIESAVSKARLIALMYSFMPLTLCYQDRMWLSMALNILGFAASSESASR